MMVTVPYTAEAGSYWVRQRVEPCLMKNPMAKLHTNLEPGTYVQVIHLPLSMKDEVRFKVHESMPMYQGRTAVITTKTFRIYFDEVTDEAELGIIRLAEQE